MEHKTYYLNQKLQYLFVEVFVESETAPLETVPLTEELMQTKVLKGARDFGTKDFVVLKDNGLVLKKICKISKFCQHLMRATKTHMDKIFGNFLSEKTRLHILPGKKSSCSHHLHR